MKFIPGGGGIPGGKPGGAKPIGGKPGGGIDWGGGVGAFRLLILLSI